MCKLHQSAGLPNESTAFTKQLYRTTVELLKQCQENCVSFIILLLLLLLYYLLYEVVLNVLNVLMPEHGTMIWLSILISSVKKLRFFKTWVLISRILGLNSFQLVSVQSSLLKTLTYT